MDNDKKQRLRNLIKLPANSSDWEFTSVLISRPVNWLLLHVVGDIGLITPNLVTVFGFLSFLGASSVLFFKPEMNILVAVLLFMRLILDDLDGMLARYRGKGSNFGSYLDKTTDIVGFFVYFTVLGLLIFKQKEHVFPMVAAMAGIFGLMGTGYVKWVVAPMIKKVEQPVEDEQKTFSPIQIFLILTFIKIWAVNECDIFLFSIIIILFKLPLEILLYVLALTQILQFVAMLVIRGLAAHRSDLPG